jgi:hypothetical protein
VNCTKTVGYGRMRVIVSTTSTNFVLAYTEKYVFRGNPIQFQRTE